MIKQTLTHSHKQSSKVDMILETGTIVKKVRVRWVGDYIPMVINKILLFPPIKIKDGRSS